MLLSSIAMFAGPTATAQGQWSGPFDTLLINQIDREFGHACLLLNTAGGPKVLLWFEEGGGATQTSLTTRTYLWDPNGGAFKRLSQKLTSNIFCSSHTFQSDGSVIASGGLVSSSGCSFQTDPTCANREAYTFSPLTLSWTATALTSIFTPPDLITDSSEI